ncbi:thioredoxin family protein [Paenibacillus sp. IB182496]|uniref:Thioredoxin family protein n=1 Tax=Paenibacillus sabuli TaxID=2772509 RepID=A0A927BRZ8_9BACL|nr:thioredoxin family protein [Paenibacillus sabuli]MBD2845696.1 thioredoxin family protein [Paenibacillus sabuli]
MDKLTTEAEFRARTAAGDALAIVVFKTTWCKDCHYIEPFMPELERQYAGRATFLEADRDELPELCEELRILGIPSFIAFYKGQELVRFVNKLRKSREEIEQFVDRALEVAAALEQR